MKKQVLERDRMGQQVFLMRKRQFFEVVMWWCTVRCGQGVASGFGRSDPGGNDYAAQRRRSVCSNADTVVPMDGYEPWQHDCRCHSHEWINPVGERPWGCRGCRQTRPQAPGTVPSAQCSRFRAILQRYRMWCLPDLTEVPPSSTWCDRSQWLGTGRCLPQCPITIL